MKTIAKLSLIPFVILATTCLRAGVPTDPAEIAKVVGQPARIDITPAKLILLGPRSSRQLLVQGTYADGSIRDLTPCAQFEAQKGLEVRLSEGGFVEATANSVGILAVKVAGQTMQLPVEAVDVDKTRPISFRHEVVATLNVGGCNMGACHGTPSGKNGFRLSLRGSDPSLDFTQLTRDVLARRTGSGRWGKSLAFGKPC